MQTEHVGDAVGFRPFFYHDSHTFAQNQPPYFLFLPRHCPQPQGPRREVRDSCGTRPLSLLLTAPGGILLPLRDWGRALGQERTDPREGRGSGRGNGLPALPEQGPRNEGAMPHAHHSHNSLLLSPPQAPTPAPLSVHVASQPIRSRRASWMQQGRGLWTSETIHGDNRAGLGAEN